MTALCRCGSRFKTPHWPGVSVGLEYPASGACRRLPGFNHHQTRSRQRMGNHRWCRHSGSWNFGHSTIRRLFLGGAHVQWRHASCRHWDRRICAAPQRAPRKGRKRHAKREETMLRTYIYGKVHRSRVLCWQDLAFQPWHRRDSLGWAHHPGRSAAEGKFNCCSGSVI